MCWTRVTRGANLRSKGQIIGNENVKIVFCSYIRQNWINLRQTKTKMITGPFYRYRRIKFHQQKCFIL